MKLFIYAFYLETSVEIQEYIYEKAVVYKNYSFKKYNQFLYFKNISTQIN